MTIINFTFLTKHNAVVAVDTLATSRRDFSKMHVIPHLGAVVAGSGRAVTFNNSVSLLQMLDTFDDALESLPMVFNHADIWRDDQLKAGGVEDVDSLFRQTLLLVGYSESRNCLAAGFVKCDKAFGPAQASTAFGSYIAPDDGADGFLPSQLATDEGAKRMMEAQYAHMRDVEKITTGGRCLVARLNANPPTRGAIKPRVEIIMRDLGPLGEAATQTAYDQAAAALGT